MRFMRVGEVGQEKPVLQDEDGTTYDLAPVVGGGDIDGPFLSSGGLDAAAKALAQRRLDRCSIEGLRIGPPVARPQAVICVGQNYAAHAAESGTEPPKSPIVFLKHPNTVVGPYDDIVVPRGSQRTDWEVELAVVIGARARYLPSEEDAARCIAGYATSNDVSERTFQLEESGGQWSKGKCCESFNPLGPWLVPAGVQLDPQALQLRSWVNGEPRQESVTADMIFGVNYLVWHLSQYLALEPGDVINTGTPQGVALSGRFPYLKAGDVVAVEVDGLGRQEQRVTASD